MGRNVSLKRGGIAALALSVLASVILIVPLSSGVASATGRNDPSLRVHTPEAANSQVSPACGVIEAESAYEEDAQGTIAALAVLEYNQCTRDVWGTNADYLSYSCSGGGDTNSGCGTNTVNRDDGAYRQCQFGSAGERSCTTGQMSDAGYLSSEHGTIWDNANHLYEGYTAQF